MVESRAMGKVGEDIVKLTSSREVRKQVIEVRRRGSLALASRGSFRSDGLPAILAENLDAALEVLAGDSSFGRQIVLQVLEDSLLERGQELGVLDEAGH
jgi:hypothetical protein